MTSQPTEQSRRDELLMKAAHLFCERGYHATSMEDIANALGILRGSLYHHITSKQDLLCEIMTRGIEHLLEEVRPIAADPTLGPEAKLGAIVRAHVLSITEHPDILTVFLHEFKSLATENLGQMLHLRDEYERIIRDVVQAGIAQGRFRAVDVPLTTFGLLGMVNWLYQWYRPGGRLAPAVIADEFADLTLRALRAD